MVDIEECLVSVDRRDQEGSLEGAKESDVRADPEEIVDASSSEFADVDAGRDALLIWDNVSVRDESFGEGGPVFSDDTMDLDDGDRVDEIEYKKEEAGEAPKGEMNDDIGAEFRLETAVPKETDVFDRKSEAAALARPADEIPSSLGGMTDALSMP